MRDVLAFEREMRSARSLRCELETSAKLTRRGMGGSESGCASVGVVAASKRRELGSGELESGWEMGRFASREEEARACDLV